ncbi:MAG: FecR domain-containing protein [Pseudomonadota bacterium]
MITADRKAREEAHLWRIRHEEGLSDTEQLQFREWYDASVKHAEAFIEAELFWVRSGDVEFQKTTLAELERLQTADSSQPPIQPVKSSYRPPNFSKTVTAGMALAAMILLCVIVLSPSLLFPVGDPEFERFASEKGQTRIITLPDNTMITLSAASEVEIALSDTQRSVRLNEGAAFFDVASDPSRPFLVDTAFADIAVTGTQFDVHLRDDLVRVAVGEGSVDIAGDGIANAEGLAVSLTAGQSIEYTSNGGFSEIAEVFPAELAAWRGGRLIYVDAPLARVLEDLNRYSSSPITADERAAAMKISGIYDASRIEAVLEAIERSLPIRLTGTGAERHFVSE